MKRSLSILFAAAIAVCAFAPLAKADITLGTTTRPSGSANNACPPNIVINQVTSDPSTPYQAPGSGTINQWSINATGAVGGSPVTFVVLRPTGASFQVVGVDTRTVPTPAPSVATYTLAGPITVATGDTLGLYTNGAAVACYWNGGATPVAATLAALGAGTTPAQGQTLNRANSDSPPGYTMNVAANFVPTPAPAPPAKKKKCKKKKNKKRSAESAKKKKCKKKKKR
jgi:hypothetical protein